MSDLSEVQKAVSKAKTEAGQTAAISRLLMVQGYSAPPTLTEERVEGYAVRTYTYEGTPYGTFSLVTGPSVEPTLVRANPGKMPKKLPSASSAAKVVAGSDSGGDSQYFRNLVRDVSGKVYQSQSDLHAAIRALFKILGIKAKVAKSAAGYTEISADDANRAKIQSIGPFAVYVDLYRDTPTDPYADYPGIPGWLIRAEFVPLVSMVLAATLKENGETLKPKGEEYLEQFEALAVSKPAVQKAVDAASYSEETISEGAKAEVVLPKKPLIFVPEFKKLEVAGDTYPIKDTVLKPLGFKFQKPTKSWLLDPATPDSKIELLSALHPQTQLIVKTALSGPGGYTLSAAELLADYKATYKATGSSKPKADVSKHELYFQAALESATLTVTMPKELAQLIGHILDVMSFQIVSKDGTKWVYAKIMETPAQLLTNALLLIQAADNKDSHLTVTFDVRAFGLNLSGKANTSDAVNYLTKVSQQLEQQAAAPGQAVSGLAETTMPHHFQIVTNAFGAAGIMFDLQVLAGTKQADRLKGLQSLGVLATVNQKGAWVYAGTSIHTYEQAKSKLRKVLDATDPSQIASVVKLPSGEQIKEGDVHDVYDWTLATWKVLLKEESVGISFTFQEDKTPLYATMTKSTESMLGWVLSAWSKAPLKSDAHTTYAKSVDTPKALVGSIIGLLTSLESTGFKQLVDLSIHGLGVKVQGEYPLTQAIDLLMQLSESLGKSPKQTGGIGGSVAQADFDALADVEDAHQFVLETMEVGDKVNLLFVVAKNTKQGARLLGLNATQFFDTFSDGPHEVVAGTMPLTYDAAEAKLTAVLNFAKPEVMTASVKVGVQEETFQGATKDVKTWILKEWKNLLGGSSPALSTVPPTIPSAGGLSAKAAIPKVKPMPSQKSASVPQGPAFQAVQGANIGIPKAPTQGAIAPDSFWDLVTTQDDVDELLDSKLGPKAGSQPGGPAMFRGRKCYIKTASNKDALAVEASSCQFYRACGVMAPDARVLKSTSGKVYLVSPWLPESSPVALVNGHCDLTTSQKEFIAGQFPVDAWLANWDVAGMTCDNLAVSGTEVYRIDAGGTMDYRATGGEKAFGPEVKELQSLLDPNTNALSTGVFSYVATAMTQSEAKKPIKASVLRILDAAKAGNYILDVMLACRMDRDKAEKRELALKKRAAALGQWVLTFSQSPLVAESLSQIDLHDGQFKVKKHVEVAIDDDDDEDIYDIPYGFSEETVLTALKKKGTGGIPYEGIVYKSNPRSNPSGYTMTGYVSKKGQEYIEYRPKMKDGSRPRIRVPVGSNTTAFSQVAQEFREQVKAKKAGKKPSKTPRILLDGLWPAPALARFHAAMSRAIGQSWDGFDLSTAAVLEVAGLPLDKATPEIESSVGEALKQDYQQTIAKLQADIELLTAAKELAEVPDEELTKAEMTKVVEAIETAADAVEPVPVKRERAITPTQKKIVDGLKSSLIQILGKTSEPDDGTGAVSPSDAIKLKNKIQAAILASTGVENQNMEKGVGEYLRWLALARSAGLWKRVLDPGNRVVFRGISGDTQGSESVFKVARGGKHQFQLTVEGEAQVKALEKATGQKYPRGNLFAAARDFLSRQQSNQPFLPVGNKYELATEPVQISNPAAVSTLARELGHAKWGETFSPPPWLDTPATEIEGLFVQYINTMWANFTVQHWTVDAEASWGTSTGIRMLSTTEHPGFILLPKLTLSASKKMPFAHEDEIMFVDLGEQYPLFVEIVNMVGGSSIGLSAIQRKLRQSIVPPYGWMGAEKKTKKKKNPAGEGGSTKIQSLLFDRERFTENQARGWAMRHGYHDEKVDVTSRFIRLRQRDPSKFDPKSFRTIVLTDGIEAVIGKPAQPKLHKSFGAVVVNDRGQFLLRKAANDFGGARWTWPKGTQDPGESPEQTAIRETIEETGYLITDLQKIPGQFRGTTSVTEYFLASPDDIVADYDDETEEIRWVSPKQAVKLISESPSPVVARRDLDVLEAALRIL